MRWLALGGWCLAASLGLLALTMRRRLELAARAEHELRGPLAALALAVEQVRRGRAGGELAGALEAQLDRSRAGLADLAAALGRGTPGRAGAGVALECVTRHTAAGWAQVAARDGRSLHLDWRAGPVKVAADRGRLAQALGNLLSNALEHGCGDVELRGRRVGRAVRIEVADAGASLRRARGAISGPAGASSGDPGPLRPNERGRGRGLAIASRAVRESGGRIEVVTGHGGTTAAVELPVEER